MFVAINSPTNLWRVVINTYGVSKLVGFNIIPQIVNSELISELKKRCDNTGKLLPFNKFQIGDDVKIIDDPFTNYIATVETL